MSGKIEDIGGINQGRNQDHRRAPSAMIAQLGPPGFADHRSRRARRRAFLACIARQAVEGSLRKCKILLRNISQQFKE
ncbi:MAG: hypothetical protein NVS3B5_11540 [Sphingomicrobium sp.]